MQLEGIPELINPKVPAFIKAAPDHNANPTGYQLRASSPKTKKCITYERGDQIVYFWSTFLEI